jgi:uncharacterized membrane protein
MSTATAALHTRSTKSFMDWLTQHWFGVVLAVYGLWVFLPFFAPLLMHVGWSGAGKTIYLIYSFFCHQLPERSYFFFGQKTMYSLSEIQAAWQATDNPFVLRQFSGNEVMGWKIAWSDRMIWFYTSVWLFAVLWFPFRRSLKPISWLGFVLLLLPMALDGGSHAISDLAGIGQGFRDTNQWLVALTNYAFSTSFYAGDGLGSFNSIMRLITGLLSGLSIAWLVFPYIFRSQALDQELDRYSYGKVIEQIKNQDPHSSSG